jgi:hypothetical protein
MNKYEKLIEYIISEQHESARELFHEIVVEKSRQIYESLDEMDATMQGDGVDTLLKEIGADEEGLSEADDDNDLDMDMPGMSMDDEGDEMDMDMGDEMDMDDEEGMDMDDEGDEEDMDAELDMGMDDEGDEEDMDAELDMGDESELKNRVVDLESALDELKAEFDSLMADQSSDEDNDEDSEDGEEMVREYVEKVAAPANKEGHEVGAGKSAAINKASPGLQKANNMGGKRFDLGKGAETAPDGQRPHSNAKAPQEIDVARRNVNKPGGNKGAQDFYGTKAKAKAGEEGGVNKNSIEPGGK